MSINESKDAVTNISLMFEGYSATAPALLRTWIYNNSASVWQTVGADYTQPSAADVVVTRWVNTSCANYINASGILKWGVSENRSNVVLNVDYVQANISWTKQIPCP
jgi:hypothetical protein